MASTREISLLDGGQMTQSYVDSRGIRKQNLEGVRRANRSNESGEEVFDYGPNKFNIHITVMVLRTKPVMAKSFAKIIGVSIP